MITFSFSQWWNTVYPLVLFLCGMVVYLIFISSFCKFLSKKEIFSLHLERYNTSKHQTVKKFFRTIFYIIQHILLYPILVFMGFVILIALMSFFSNNNTEMMILISVALIGSIRIIAYLSENLASDLSKMLPFSLLAVYLLDPNYISLAKTFEKIYSIPSFSKTILYYLLLIIFLEIILRILYELYNFIINKKTNKN